MTPLFSDGFDDGDFSGWTVFSGGGTATCSTVAVLHGSYGVILYAPTGYAIQLRAPSFGGAGLSEVWGRCYLKFTQMTSKAAGGTGLPFRLLSNGTTQFVLLVRDVDGAGRWEIGIRYRNSSGVMIDVPPLGAGFPFDPFQWHCVELYGKAGTGGRGMVYLDGEPVVDTGTVSASANLLNGLEIYLTTGQLYTTRLYADTVAADTSRVGPLRGFRVYDNAGAGPIRYATAQALLPEFTTARTSGTLACPATWRFGVRAFNEYGEEQNLDVATELVLLASGAQSPARPNRPVDLAARATAGGGVEIAFGYDATDEAAVCSHFHVYSDSGAGDVNYASPIGSLERDDAGTLTRYTFLTGALTDGLTQRFAVRAATAADVEDDGIESVAATPDATAPAQPATLSVQVVR